jgi:hypothetical protein
VVYANEIGKMSTNGAVTHFNVPTPIPEPGTPGLAGIAGAADGNVWFAEIGANKIAEITPAGAFTEFALGTSPNGLPATPRGVAAGPQGTVIFIEEVRNRLGQITTAKTDGFIGSLYLNDLGRSPSSVEVSAWESILPSQGTAAVVQEIGRSNEAYAHIVNGLYMRYLGRQTDAGGLTGFVNYLQSGGTEEGVASAILGSPEYYNRVSAGSVDPTGAFVQALYHDLLNRTAASSEVVAWENATAAIGRTAVASTFLGSGEYRSDVVASDYLSLLHRGATAAEKQAWAISGLDLYSIELLFETTVEYLLGA